MKRKKIKNANRLKPWLTVNEDGDDFFVQVGSSLLRHAAFISLSFSAQRLYLCMCEAAGRNREFKLSKSQAGKWYGIKPSTFSNAVEELKAAGFIERIDSPNQYEAAKYRFISDWKK